MFFKLHFPFYNIDSTFFNFSQVKVAREVCAPTPDPESFPLPTHRAPEAWIKPFGAWMPTAPSPKTSSCQRWVSLWVIFSEMKFLICCITVMFRLLRRSHCRYELVVCTNNYRICKMLFTFAVHDLFSFLSFSILFFLSLFRYYLYWHFQSLATDFKITHPHNHRTTVLFKPVARWDDNL